MEPDAHEFNGHSESARKYLSIYTIERVYGGSEEGGWWYNWYTPVMAVAMPQYASPDVENTFIKKHLEYTRDAFGARYQGDMLGDRKVPSHCSMSQYRATHMWLVEDEPFQSETTERPHYE